MGVSVSSKNHSIDLGYFGFFRLRRQVARLVGEDVGIHYAELSHPHFFTDKKAEAAYWEKYDGLTEYLIGKYPGKVRKVFDFLYAPDAEGSATYGTCSQVLGVIGDYDDDIPYGYVGRPDCAMFRDFKMLLQDCVDTKTKLEWH